MAVKTGERERKRERELAEQCRALHALHTDS